MLCAIAVQERIDILNEKLESVGVEKIDTQDAFDSLNAFKTTFKKCKSFWECIW